MMAGMKHFTLALALLFCLLPSPRAMRADADALRYAVAADSNVWFYASEEESAKLFLIPETYYVRILAEGEEYTAVEYLVNDPPYKKVMGYCRTEAITPVSFLPERPFLMKQITLQYSIPVGGTLDGGFSSIERTFVYYGMRYDMGQLYLYVLSDGVFGYVAAEAPPEFEKNVDYLEAVDVPANGQTEPSDSDMGTPNVLAIVLICAASVAVVVAAALLLKSRRQPPPDSEEGL